MKKRNDLDLLRKFSSLFIDVVGSPLNELKLLKKELNIGFFVWARSKPKDIFNNFIDLNNLLTKNKLNVIIDDNCSKIYMKLEQSVQDELIDLYYDFFGNRCQIFLSSKQNKISIEDFFAFLQKIPHKSYYNFLPKKKRINLSDLTLGELMHTYLEIKTIEFAFTFCDVLLLGKRSSNIAYFYHEYVNSQNQFIIVDDF
ncbi:MAG: hypothetical protein J6C13_02445 [Clostridia bacterium]|nr:hypothetical protein [Clostridia bacterium]